MDASSGRSPANFRLLVQVAAVVLFVVVRGLSLGPFPFILGVMSGVLPLLLVPPLALALIARRRRLDRVTSATFMATPALLLIGGLLADDDVGFKGDPKASPVFRLTSGGEFYSGSGWMIVGHIGWACLIASAVLVIVTGARLGLGRTAVRGSVNPDAERRAVD